MLCLLLGKVTHDKNEYKKKEYFDSNYFNFNRCNYLCFCCDESYVSMSDVLEQKNTKLIRKLVFIVLGMFGFGYALVPIYNVFCDITGLNGKTNTEAVTEVMYEIDTKREVNIEFITSLNESAPMAFHTKTKKMKIHPGQYYTVNFYAENKTDRKMHARAIPSVTPGLAAKYLIKTECFCFTDQTFEPQQGKTMPVRFVIDPELPAKFKTITLAYTFFDNTEMSVKKQQGVAYVYK